jgi:hypothetical protein
MIYKKPEAEIEHVAHMKAYDNAVQAAAFCFEAGGDYKSLAYQVYATNYPRYVIAIRAAEDAVQTYQEALGEIAKQPTNEELLEEIKKAGGVE